MELDKRKYNREEVKKIISDLSLEYEEKLSEQKARIAELVHDNADIRKELSSYHEKDEQIADAIKNAQSYAYDLNKKAQDQYDLTAEYISAFVKKWKSYFDNLKEKYPIYPIVSDADSIRKKIENIVGKLSSEEIVHTSEREIMQDNAKKDTPFNPKEKIADYIAATEDNWFRMEEVLNPGALSLEDLCKELGLLTEKDL